MFQSGHIYNSKKPPFQGYKVVYTRSSSLPAPLNKGKKTIQPALESQPYSNNGNQGHNHRRHRPNAIRSAPIGFDISDIRKALQGHLRESASAGELKQLVTQLPQNVGRAALGAHDDLPSTALGDNKGGCLIIKRKAVRIWAHSLGGLAVPGRFADLWVVVFPDTALLVRSRCCTCTLARGKVWSLNFVIRIGVDAISRLSGRKGK